MKKLIALMLSIFTILLVSTSAFASGFSGGTRGIDSFSGSGFDSDTLDTKLSYEALNTLAVNINYGLQSGEIAFDSGIDSVSVVLWDAWNAYVIIGRSSGVNYVVVNGSGGRYYSPLPEEESQYTFSAIAGATGYCITDRPPGTVGTDYLGDFQVLSENMVNIHTLLTDLGSNATFYSVYRPSPLIERYTE